MYELDHLNAARIHFQS